MTVPLCAPMTAARVRAAISRLLRDWLEQHSGAAVVLELNAAGDRLGMRWTRWA